MRCHADTFHIPMRGGPAYVDAHVHLRAGVIGKNGQSRDASQPCNSSPSSRQCPTHMRKDQMIKIQNGFSFQRLIHLQVNHAAPSPLRTETLRYNLIICQRFPLACFNSDQIEKGPRLYQQPDVEPQETEYQLRKSEAADNQGWVRLGSDRQRFGTPAKSRMNGERRPRRPKIRKPSRSQRPRSLLNSAVRI